MAKKKVNNISKIKKDGYRYFYVYAVRKENGNIRKICYDFFSSAKKVDLTKDFENLKLLIPSACESKKKRITDTIELISVALICNLTDKKPVYRYRICNGVFDDDKSIRITEMNYTLSITAPFSEDTVEMLTKQGNYNKMNIVAVKLIEADDEESKINNTTDFCSILELNENENIKAA